MKDFLLFLERHYFALQWGLVVIILVAAFIQKIRTYRSPFGYRSKLKLWGTRKSEEGIDIFLITMKPSAGNSWDTFVREMEKWGLAFADEDDMTYLLHDKALPSGISIATRDVESGNQTTIIHTNSKVPHEKEGPKPHLPIPFGNSYFFCAAIKGCHVRKKARKDLPGLATQC
jgi:hypothetical protein